MVAGALKEAGSVETQREGQALPASYPGENGGAVASFESRIRELAEHLQIEEAEALAGQLAEKGLSLVWGILADVFHGVDGPMQDEVRWLELKARHALAGGLRAESAAFEVAGAHRAAGRSEEAVVWLQRAAGLGSEEAAIVLGFAYANGEGLAADPLEAVCWFLRSLGLPPTARPLSDVTTWPVARGIGWRDWELYRKLMRRASPTQRVAITDLVIPSEYEGEVSDDGVAPAQKKAGPVSVKHAEARWVRVANLGCGLALVILVGAVLRLAGLHDAYGVVACLLLMAVPLLTLAALNL